MGRRIRGRAFTAVALVAAALTSTAAQQPAAAGARQPASAARAVRDVPLRAPALQVASAAEAPTTAASVPFGVGEEMLYKAKLKWTLFGGSGDASLRVEAIDTVQSNPSYRLVMRLKGGISFYKADDVQRSWLDVDELFSRRFEQKLNQTTYDRDRSYDFLVEEGRYVDMNNPSDSGELASLRPLDDISFVYHVRMLPLEVGKEYTEPRYYKSDGNPVTVRVLRTERIMVPAGEFDAIVIQPIIRREKSLFKEGGEGEIWLSNDERRLILKVRGKSFASITLELQSFKMGAPAEAAQAPR